MALGTFDLSGSGALSANVGRMIRGQQKHRDEQYAAMDTRAALPSSMRGLSNGGFGFDSFGPGHSGAWDAFFQGMDEASGGKPVKLSGLKGTNMGRTFDPRYQGSAVEGIPPPTGVGISYGADAEIARRERALHLSGLDAAENQARIAAEPQYLQQQRRNLAAHGTIEDPGAYKTRMGQEGAADLLDERTPQGALRARTAEEKLAQATEAARIAAGSRRDVADINAGAKNYAADQGLAGAQVRSQADMDAAVMRAFQGILTSRYAADQDVTSARRGMAEMRGDDVEPERVAPEPQSLWQWFRNRNTQAR